MDALSGAANSVHMTGALFYHAVCTSPWAFAVPPLREYAHLLAPGSIVAVVSFCCGGAPARSVPSPPTRSVISTLLYALARVGRP